MPTYSIRPVRPAPIKLTPIVAGQGKKKRIVAVLMTKKPKLPVRTMGTGQKERIAAILATRPTMPKRPTYVLY